MATCIKDFFTYETTKSVVVKSPVIGVLNRIVQLLILSYFVGYVFLHQRAYQTPDTGIESSVMTKVKGLGLYNSKVMDVADYVTPPQGASVFCIVTKLITTENQVQDECAESETKYACKSDSQCKMNEQATTGIMTGKCVNYNDTFRTCQVKGWCPAEDDTVHMMPMREVENFTIFIKNSIRFPNFNFTKGNVMENITSIPCRFDLYETDPKNLYCPIFRVGDILRYAKQDFNSIAQKGGVIGIKISWVCDLDKSEDHCNPKFDFTRLDATNNKVSKGYNFRHAKYYKSENGTEHRTLIKAFGIRFDVMVTGTARKFDIVPTLINIVAAFTSVGVGTVLCDIILLNFLKGGDRLKAVKFEEVSDDESMSFPSQSNDLYQGSSTELSVSLSKSVKTPLSSRADKQILHSQI
ncbi:hypothetical protein AGOR_G00182610 [Albula goreensis]|uniref:P2X purinoceptor n=1 Tax=Albula goreensis TaxID=1534307 RepID=A0A8T3CXY4_9TELE|nr:hypothetical protein AGOR_G00182610 [Albula goreensis]